MTGLYAPADATTDDSGLPSQSTLVYATHEERTPMDGTKQSELRVLDGVRTGGLPRAMTDGF
jgi:hypothetical protein